MGHGVYCEATLNYFDGTIGRPVTLDVLDGRAGREDGLHNLIGKRSWLLALRTPVGQRGLRAGAGIGRGIGHGDREKGIGKSGCGRSDPGTHHGRPVD